MNKQRVRTVLKYILFLMYIALLVYVVLFAEMFGRTTISEYYRYNLVPFREIMRFVTHSRYLGLTVVLLNVLGNVIAFVPLGCWIPILSNSKTGALKVFLFSFAGSLVIELVQLITRVGSCDVDDIILNTIGGMAGFGLYHIVIKVCKALKSQ